MFNYIIKTKTIPLTLALCCAILYPIETNAMFPTKSQSSSSSPIGLNASVASRRQKRLSLIDNKRSPSPITISQANTKLTSAPATTGFPINLLNNQTWSIAIVTDGIMGFGVKRDGETMTATPYVIDKVTGGISNSDEDFRARFYTDLQGTTVLQLLHTWYEFPTIMRGEYWDGYAIPVNVLDGTVDGNETTSSDYSESSYVQHGQYAVKVISKAFHETPCDIRGQHYLGKLIYFTEKSPMFHSLDHFTCFSTEQSAKAAGYKPSQY